MLWLLLYLVGVPLTYWLFDKDGGWNSTRVTAAIGWPIEVLGGLEEALVWLGVPEVYR